MEEWVAVLTVLAEVVVVLEEAHVGLKKIQNNLRKGVLNMPRGDGTGPGGLGPMTGRRAGYCAGNDVPGYASSVRGFINRRFSNVGNSPYVVPPPARGFGRGCVRGRGGAGRGPRWA